MVDIHDTLVAPFLTNQRFLPAPSICPTIKEPPAFSHSGIFIQFCRTKFCRLIKNALLVRGASQNPLAGIIIKKNMALEVALAIVSRAKHDRFL